MNTDVTQRVLLALLSNALFNRQLDIPSNADWISVHAESIMQSVSAMAFSAVPYQALPDEVAEKWKRFTQIDIFANSRILYNHAKLHKLLSEADIPYVILKGSVSASYYPDPYIRSMGDVDFLIDRENIEKVDRILRAEGYTPNGLNHECEQGYKNNSSHIELHWEVNGVPGGEVGKRTREYLRSIINDAEYSEEFGGYMKPSVFHHGLVMLLHVARHMTTGGIGLRHLCDWAVFADKVGDDFDKIFEKKLKSIGMYRFARIISQMAVAYLGLESYSWIGKADEKLISDLMDDVFEGGNFGHKDMSRGDEAKFITSRKKGKVNNDSNFIQAVLSANEIVRRHWRSAEEIPLLYPFGWLYFGMRYFLRSLTGKRKKLDVIGLMDSADKRKNIYRELDLFEIED